MKLVTEFEHKFTFPDLKIIYFDIETYCSDGRYNKVP